MADNNGGFLGGGPQFNKVGASVTDDGTPEAVVETPQSMQPYQVRKIIIAIVLIVLFAVIFIVSDQEFGITHKGGRGSVNVDSKPTPGRDF